MLQCARIPSPIGELCLVMRENRVCALAFADAFVVPAQRLRRRFGRIDGAPGPATHDAATRLAAYFAGDRDALDALPIDAGGTPFQERVWTALRGIPAGETITYRELARRAGVPDAVRAVGAANGANPVWLAIPCHRVIGSDGSLTGYGGGLARKRWLLVHEGGLLR